MELEQIIIDNPQLNKITEQMMNEVTLDKLGVILDYNKSFYENGFDDLDCVEVVMELERKLDIVVSDEILSILFNPYNKPPRFQQYWRNKKLENLGI